MNDLVTITMYISKGTKQLRIIQSVNYYLIGDLLNMMNIESDEVVKTKNVKQIVVQLLKYQAAMAFMHKIVW